MNTVSPTMDSRTLKTLSVLLSGISKAGGEKVGIAYGVDRSRISQMKQPGGEFERIARMLTALGLKVVPTDFKCVDRQEYAQLKRYAVQQLNREDDADTGIHLSWDRP